MADVSDELRKHFDSVPPGEFDSPLPVQANGTGRRIDPYDLLDVAGLCAMPPVKYIGETNIPENGLGLIYGPPGSAKSFLALEFALQTALKSPVIYIAGEGIGGMGKRVRAWLLHNNRVAGELEFYVIREPVIFLDQDNKAKLLATLNGLINLPALVVVDTLARSYGGDENSSADMSEFVRVCDQVRGLTGAAVLIVHHSPKDGRGPRGSTALPGALDVAFEIAKDGHAIKVSCPKMKDNEETADQNFELTVVDLGEESSCVLVPTETVPKAKAKIKLTSRERKSLEILQSLIAEIGEPRTPRTGMPVVMVVTLDRWRERLQSMGATDRNENATERAQWSAIRRVLVSKEQIGVWETLVWVAQ